MLLHQASQALPYLPESSNTPYLIYLSAEELKILLAFWLPLISRDWLKELFAGGCQLSSIHGRELLPRGQEAELKSSGYEFHVSTPLKDLSSPPHGKGNAFDRMQKSLQSLNSIP